MYGDGVYAVVMGHSLVTENELPELILSILRVRECPGG